MRDRFVTCRNPEAAERDRIVRDQLPETLTERIDGRFLLRTSDPSLSAEHVALGYKQLLEVERGWRDMKSTLDLRPVYHRLEGRIRIRAHVLLCCPSSRRW